MTVEMRTVFSSLVNEVGYDRDTAELHVRYKPSKKRPDGALCIYSNVPPEIGMSVVNAPSIGLAINESIKGTFPFRYGT